MVVWLYSLFLTLLCSRGRRDLPAPSRAKPTTRVRCEFWFFYCDTVFLKKKIKTIITACLGAFFLQCWTWHWDFDIPEVPAPKIQLSTSAVCSPALQPISPWSSGPGHKQVTEAWAKQPGCSLAAPNQLCVTSHFVLTRGYKRAWKRLQSRCNLLLFVLLTAGWLPVHGRGAGAVNVLKVRVTLRWLLGLRHWLGLKIWSLFLRVPVLSHKRLPCSASQGS